MVLSNHKGKIVHTLGVVQVDLNFLSITRPTMFMAITSRVNYNLFLHRKWIHGIEVVPSLLHQRISILRDDSIMEHIEDDQSYFMAEVNHVDNYHFNRNLANIAPCSPADFPHMPYDKAFYYLNLHPTHGFNWDREIMGEVVKVERVLSYPKIRLTLHVII